MPVDPQLEQQILGGNWGRQTVNQDTGWDTSTPSASQRDWSGNNTVENNYNGAHPGVQNQGTEAWANRGIPNNRRQTNPANTGNKPLLPGHPQSQINQNQAAGYSTPAQGTNRMQSPPTNGWGASGGQGDWARGQNGGPNRGHRGMAWSAMFFSSICFNLILL